MAPLIRLGSLALLLLGGPALAGDWTSWRGPGQDGVSDETGIVAEPTPAGATLTLELPRARARRHSCDPALLLGLQDESGGALAEVLVAMDTTTGEVIWRLPFATTSPTSSTTLQHRAPSVDPARGGSTCRRARRADGVSPEGEVCGRLDDGCWTAQFQRRTAPIWSDK
jgi:hypothetical protein